MTLAEAGAMLAPAVPPGAGTWLDVGAGEGLFTQALAHRIGDGGTVIAIDRDAAALRSIPASAGAAIRTHAGDIRQLGQIDGLPELLDGVLCANVLHFVLDPEAVLIELASRLVPGGRMVVIEYDREHGSRWVPHPIPRRQLDALLTGAGFEAPDVVGTQTSRFGGEMYVASARLRSTS